MTTRIQLVCDHCGRMSVEHRSKPEDIRRVCRVAGWSSGYVHKPYAGKRADFCPMCAAYNSLLQRKANKQ